MLINTFALLNFAVCHVEVNFYSGYLGWSSIRGMVWVSGGKYSLDVRPLPLVALFSAAVSLRDKFCLVRFRLAVCLVFPRFVESRDSPDYSFFHFYP